MTFNDRARIFFPYEVTISMVEMMIGSPQSIRFWYEMKHDAMDDQTKLKVYFADWESDIFGFGYGTGEQHILPALHAFLSLCDGERGMYDYRKIAESITAPVAWLLINVLCKSDIIEYGSSPRFAWLTKEGIALRDFVTAHTIDDLYENLHVADVENNRAHGPKSIFRGVLSGEEQKITHWINPWLRAAVPVDELPQKPAA